MLMPSPVAIASRSRKLIAALGRKVAGMAAELGLLLEPGKYSIVLPTKAVKTPVSKWSWPAGSTSPDALRNHVRAVLRALGGVVQQGADLEAQRSAGHPVISLRQSQAGKLTVPTIRRRPRSGAK